VCTALNVVSGVLKLEAYAFTAVFISLSVSVRRSEDFHHVSSSDLHLHTIVGNVPDCGDNLGRNSTFDDGYL